MRTTTTNKKHRLQFTIIHQLPCQHEVNQQEEVAATSDDHFYDFRVSQLTCCFKMRVVCLEKLYSDFSTSDLILFINCFLNVFA